MVITIDQFLILHFRVEDMEIYEFLKIAYQILFLNFLDFAWRTWLSLTLDKWCVDEDGSIKASRMRV